MDLWFEELFDEGPTCHGPTTEVCGPHHNRPLAEFTLLPKRIMMCRYGYFYSAPDQVIAGMNAALSALGGATEEL